VAQATTINVDHERGNLNSHRDQRYAAAVLEFGRALDRLAAGYEADPDKRHDLRQDIHLQLWKSLEGFDGRCSLKTWTFRVAHNAAVSYVTKERRKNSPLVSLEELEQTPCAPAWEPDIDQHRSLQRLSKLILNLKPLDRQIMLSYLEEMDNQTISDITGLSPANVAMKVHRIKAILSRRLLKEQHNA
jgi:RNA polymerase sigma-70 factor (ECF subfamily)